MQKIQLSSKQPGWKVALPKLLLLLMVGCGSSSNDFVGTVNSNAASSPLAPLQLSKTWGGYFPGSSFQHPETGLELHLDGPFRNGMLHRAGFIHRANLQGHRHDVQVQKSGSEVVLIFDPGSSDEGRFNGTLVDDHTLRGTYTNQNRNESLNLDLVAADSVSAQLRPLHQAKALESTVLPQSSANGYLTLRLDFLDSYPGFPSIQNNVFFGLGPYYNSGFADSHWQSNNNFNNGEYHQLEGVYGVNTVNGFSTVSTMFFFPDWLLLDLYAIPDEVAFGGTHLASFELPWSALLNLDASHLATGSYAYQTFSRHEFDGTNSTITAGSISNMRLSWERTSERCDIENFAVPADKPDYRTVVVGGNAYSVPANARRLLESLNFVIPYQQ